MQLQRCRNCDQQPRVKGSLYCEPCKKQVDSHNGALQRQAHAAEGCWCPECIMDGQRTFRMRQANARAARDRALASRPWEPEPPGPRAA